MNVGSRYVSFSFTVSLLSSEWLYHFCHRWYIFLSSKSLWIIQPSNILVKENIWLHQWKWYSANKSNQELDKIIKHKNIINFISAQRLGWLGQIERMQEIWIVKSIHSWKPISRRDIWRPKLRWEDDVRKDIQKLKVQNLKTLVRDRRRWKEFVEKAKTLHKEL
jgi:hypothetical protein